MKPKTRKCFIGVVYANWCPHCITLVGNNEASYATSDWHRIKTIFENAIDHKNKGMKYDVSHTESANTTEINNLKTDHHIVANGFPTIYKYYINSPGEKSTGLEYFSNGPRDINSILKWARNHARGSGFKFSGGGKTKRIRGRKTRRGRRATRRR